MTWFPGNHKSEPIGKFCQLVTALPEAEQPQVLRMCGLVLGWQTDPEEALIAENPVDELFRAPDLEELCARMNVLILDMGMRADFLIPALLRHISDFYDRASLSSATSAAIDHDLEWLEKMEEQKRKPQGERSAFFTDEFIEHAIEHIKSSMQQRIYQTSSAQKTAELLEGLIREHFPDGYWMDRLRQEIEGD
jgi:hypothetical protein